MTIDDYMKLKDELIAKGFVVRCNNTTNYHTSITGKCRRVELYPTTGTVNASPVKGKYGSYTAKNMSLERAVDRACAVADHGH